MGLWLCHWGSDCTGELDSSLDQELRVLASSKLFAECTRVTEKMREARAPIRGRTQDSDASSESTSGHDSDLDTLQEHLTQTQAEVPHFDSPPLFCHYSPLASCLHLFTYAFLADKLILLTVS